MKYILVVALVFCSFVLISCDGGGGGNATNKPANSANNAASNTATATVNHEADVKKFISDFAVALSKNDAAALDKFYADDYTLVTQTGEIITKAARLDAIKKGDLKFENVAFNVEKVQSYGDVAVVTASSSGKNINKGKETTANYQITFVVNKTKDGWRLVNAHLSPKAEAAKTTEANKTTDANKPAEANKTAEANKPANK